MEILKSKLEKLIKIYSIPYRKKLDGMDWDR